MDEDLEALFDVNQPPYVCPFDAELQTVARRDVKEERSIRESSLREFREWVIAQPHLVHCRLDSSFLLRFLRVTKFSMPRAKLMLERYLMTKMTYPYWFQKLDILEDNVDDLISKGFIFALPQRDNQGRRVIFGIGTALDPSKHSTSQTMRAFVLTFETLLEDETNHVRGFTYIFDQKNVGLRAATMWTPNAFRKALHCTEKSLPMRHKQCHFVHLPAIIRTLFEFFKTFLSPKLRQRLIVHSDLQSLSQQIPLKILPREYGGQIPLQEMIDLWKKELVAKRSRILTLDNMFIDEHRRRHELGID